MTGTDRLAGTAAAPDAERGTTVLVAYASRFGSTRGIAKRIAARLEARGLTVALHPVDEVETIAGYEAVVLGSPVFDQRWMPEVDAFARRHRGALAGCPAWLFSVGTFGDRKRVIGRLMRHEPKGIGELTRAIAPRDYRVFAGVIDRHQWPRLSRVFFHALGGRLGDNRDWPEIDTWADGIAGSLRGDPART